MPTEAGDRRRRHGFDRRLSHSCWLRGGRRNGELIQQRSEVKRDLDLIDVVAGRHWLPLRLGDEPQPDGLARDAGIGSF